MGSVYVMLQASSFDILFMWDRGSLGPWVKVPKALEEDTPMWVYEVGLALGFNSLKTRGLSYPWVLVPKDTGLVLLPLGFST